MNDVLALTLASTGFVGTHFLLSHPLRRPIAERTGERAFQGLYSLVALLTFGVTIWTYDRIGDQPRLVALNDTLAVIAILLMWIASILLVGSFVGNPALPGARRPKSAPRGVFAVTRHPMMWAFALWAIVHAVVIATLKALIFDGAILFLALVGAALQDRKKRATMGETWHEWTAQTAFLPFARGLASPGVFALVGGTLLFLLATWLHPTPIGVFRWIG